MNLDSSLLLIFSDQSDFHEKGEALMIRYVLTEDRIVELPDLKEILLKIDAGGFFLENFPAFNNIAELQRVAFHLCEGLQKEKVYLLTLASLNNLIEHSESSDQVLQQIPALSNVIQNVELIEKKEEYFFSSSR